MQKFKEAETMDENKIQMVLNKLLRGKNESWYYDGYFKALNADERVELIIRVYKISLESQKSNLLDSVIKQLQFGGYYEEFKIFIQYLISSQNYKKLFDVIENISQHDKHSAEFRKGILRMVSQTEIKLYLEQIEKPSLYFLVIYLWKEVEQILNEFKEIDFKQNPEIAKAITILTQTQSQGILKYYKNYEKLYEYINKIIKEEKTILSLYILNEYGWYKELIDAKLCCDTYINALIQLERFDVISTCYTHFDILQQNREFLQHITNYFISAGDIKKAKESLSYIAKIEPQHSFIKKSNQILDRMQITDKLLSENIDVEHINEITGQEFEELLIKKFRFLGFKAMNTSVTGDFGADIIIDTHDGTRFIIQCKRFKNKVNLKAVQEVVAALAHYNGDIGIVITNNGFLASAITLAESNAIELWDNYKLLKFLSGDLSFSQMYEWKE